MAVKKKSEKRIKKENYWTRLQNIANKYQNVMFVDANNVSSKQISMIRFKLRAIGAVMIMGKNVSALHLKPSFQTPSASQFGDLREFRVLYVK